MDILSIVRMARRHWVVVILSLAIATAAVAAVVVSTPPTYRATSSVVLLNPPEAPASVTEDAGEVELRALENPYERFNDLSIVVDIIRRVLASDPSMDTLVGRGLQGTYTVAANIDFYRGPIIDVAAEAGTEAEALRATQLVVDLLQQTLDDVQTRQGTDPDYFITSDVVVPATRATLVLSSTLRRAVATAAAGALFVLGMVIVADSFSERRREKAAEELSGALKPPELVFSKGNQASSARESG